MTDSIRITLAQLNPTLGDLEGNAAKARSAWEKGRDAGADFVVLPEMFITGYQTQDLVLKKGFVAHAVAQVEALARECADGPALGIGTPWAQDGKLYNAFFVCEGGKVVARVLKHELPHKQLFDEMRLFDEGPISGPYSIKGVRIGSPICEDAWWPDVAEALEE